MSKALKKVQLYFKNINKGIQACSNYFDTCDYHTVSSILSIAGLDKYLMLVKRGGGGGLALFEFLGEKEKWIFSGGAEDFQKVVFSC